MQQIKIAEKDFDQWVELAKNDPSSFESQRQAAIEAVIQSAPVQSQERLRRLQWRIDQERRLAHTPLNACIRITRMMWKSVLGRGGLRDQFQELSEIVGGERAELPNRVPQGAESRVLAFARSNAD